MTLFQQGMAAYCAASPTHDGEAARCFQQAFDDGDLNAGWMLALCYEEGIGVPKDLARIYRIATQLHERGYPAAEFWLSECYEYGNGVEIDEDKAMELSASCFASCQHSQEGLDESIRHECLNLLTVNEDLSDEEEEAIHAEYREHCKFPHRFAQWAEQLMREDEAHECDEHRDTVLDLLNQGVALRDEAAILLLAELYRNQDHAYDVYNKQEAAKLMELRPYAALDYAEYLRADDREEEAQREMESYWKLLRYGKSLLRRDRELAAEVSFVQNTAVPLIRVFDHQVTRSIMEGNELTNAVHWPAPLLRIEGLPIGTEVQIRVRITSDEVDCSFTVYTSETCQLIDLTKDRGIELSNFWDVEISTNQGSTRMLVPYHALLFVQNPKLPACVLSWRKKWFQGYALQVFAHTEEGVKVQVHLSDGVVSRPLILAEDEHAELTASDFTPKAPLTMGRPFVLISPDCAPCIGVIAPPPRGPQQFDTDEAQDLAAQLT